MLGAGSHTFGVARNYLHKSVSVVVGAISELTLRIPTSTPHATVLLQHYAVPASRSNDLRLPRQNLHEIGHHHILRHVNPELTKRVNTSGPYAAILLES